MPWFVLEIYHTVANVYLVEAVTEEEAAESWDLENYITSLEGDAEDHEIVGGPFGDRESARKSVIIKEGDTWEYE